MRRTNRLYAWLLLCLFLIPGQSVIAREKKERPPVDVKELIMGHLKDTYKWHFFTIGEKEIELHLPVIVHSRERGWFVFMSSRLEEQPEYKGFYYVSGGISDGKIVERNSAGKEVRPFDISITKDVLALFVACGLMIWLVLSTAAWYKKRDA
ncbi:MAG: F0F1 ATP synthase subunit A, partial [Bacteroidales bacterium]